MASIREVSNTDSSGTARIGSYLVETGAKSGLVQLLECAFRLTDASAGPAVLLDIETQPTLDPTWISIQANVLPRKARTLAAVTLRVRTKIPSKLDHAKLLRSLLGAFGGSRYVSFSAGPRNRRAGNFEAVMWTPGALPCLVTNDVTLPRLMTIDQADVYADVLDTLGVKFSRTGSRFAVASRQWRLPLRTESIVTAYRSAQKLNSAAIYAACLPFVQSVRFASSKADSARQIDCAVSRGMSRRNGCSSVDLHEMEHWVTQHLDTRLSNRFWRVEAYTAFTARTRQPHQSQRHIPTGS